MSAAPGNPVLVIGATGTVGRHVCETLRQSGASVLAASRSGQAPAGSRGVRFDWYDARTWAAATEGVSRMYVIAPSGESDPLTAMSPFLEFARQSGVERAVLQSSSLIESGDPGLGRVHAAIEGTYPEWAVLRPSWFMQNFTGRHPHADGIRERGAITTATGTGRVGFIDAQDIARVAGSVLVAVDAPNCDPILTGPEALSYDGVAAVITRASGQLVSHRQVGRDRMCQIYTAVGLSPDYAAMLAGLDVKIAADAENRITDEVLRWTGAPPRSFEQFAAETAWQVGTSAGGSTTLAR